jgi:2-polyprenyl-3-methyl-5-hydroxy-6-metoxy-1,4-benzoquinol methylase
MMREELIRSQFDTSGLNLEIGPSYNPILPKAAGFTVETVDATDRAGLIEKYRNEKNVDWCKIEEVDYVITDGSLLGAIPHRSRYDAIVASNVIEHTPDLVAFLRDCAALLKQTGQLILINPDKRYCFDVFRPLTSTGNVLQAFLEGRSRHTPSSIFDLIASKAFRGGMAGWGADDRGDLALEHSLQAAWAGLQNSLQADYYIDCHSWVFTPSSFRLIVKDLHELGLIELNEARFVPSICWFEFYVALSRSGKGCDADRLSLHREVVNEQAGIVF